MQELPCLRQWSLSGEPLPAALAHALLQPVGSATTECVLLNLYGSTEVCGDVTVRELRDAAGVVADGSTVPIGLPLQNGTQLWVVRPHSLMPCEEGEEGARIYFF